MQTCYIYTKNYKIFSFINELVIQIRSQRAILLWLTLILFKIIIMCNIISSALSVSSVKSAPVVIIFLLQINPINILSATKISHEFVFMLESWPCVDEFRAPLSLFWIHLLSSVFYTGYFLAWYYLTCSCSQTDFFQISFLFLLLWITHDYI